MGRGGIDRLDDHQGRTIGFLAPAIHGYFWGNVLTGVVRTATARGGRVMAIQAFDAGLVDFPNEERFTARLGWQSIDALVVGQAAVTDAYLREFSQTGKPVMAVYRQPEEFPCPTVVPDNRDGIRLALDHLIEHGHRTIAFVCRHRADADEWIRYRAYEEIMLARGLRPSEPVLVSWRLDETYDAAEAVRQLRERDAMPSAALACTDLVAMAFIKALAQVGVVVPTDMAVIGFDDIADAATFQPALSTVAQNFALAGTAVCDLAFNVLDGSCIAPGYYCTPVALITRESCGCSPVISPPQPSGHRTPTTLRAQLVHELGETLHSGRRLTSSQRRELITVTDDLAALLTRIPGTPVAQLSNVDLSSVDLSSVDLSSSVESVSRQLRQLAAQSPNPLSMAGAIRQFTQTFVGTIAPNDLVLAARYDQFAFDIALRLLENQNLDVRGRPFANRDVEIQRRYYMIGTNLVRQRSLTAGSLDWLAMTEFQAGCLALWDTGRGNRDGATLRIVSIYDKSGRCPPLSGTCAVTAFPPASFIDLINDRNSGVTYLYVLPVRFAGSDWGFLALTGQLDLREEAAFERYNHWAVLLTVALDHEHAIQSERALLEDIRVSEERYALAAEASNDGLWDWNLISGAVFYSSRWKSLVGVSEEEIAATTQEWLGRIHPEDRPAVDRAIARQLDGRSSTMELEYRLRTADGIYRWMLTHARSMCDSAGTVTRLVGSMTDITDRKLLEERLRHDAHYDPLTGLPNRALFLDRLQQAIAGAHRHSEYRFAVVFLDLDGFKIINDSLGHQVGDEVLTHVAQRLIRQARPQDTVARFGGDEFVLLLDDICDVASLPTTVNRILSVISAPLTIDDRILTVSAAAGIAPSGNDRATADEYLQDADAAMYQAKAAGSGSFVLFDRSASTTEGCEPSPGPDVSVE